MLTSPAPSGDRDDDDDNIDDDEDDDDDDDDGGAMVGKSQASLCVGYAMCVKVHIDREIIIAIIITTVVCKVAY
jgi:hypothetical protein